MYSAIYIYICIDTEWRVKKNWLGNFKRALNYMGGMAFRIEKRTLVVREEIKEVGINLDISSRTHGRHIGSLTAFALLASTALALIFGVSSPRSKRRILHANSPHIMDSVNSNQS